ncbi:MAG: hypothetical protein KAS13_09035 [Candidatus Omnitrophica bacterium]|nr:hypothetical protein [Candidatus Omnitrophota bacterium]
MKELVRRLRRLRGLDLLGTALIDADLGRVMETILKWHKGNSIKKVIDYG